MRLAKYHGCGNDFLIGTFRKNIDYAKVIPLICNRYTGIGADGVMLMRKLDKAIMMKFYNADGSAAAMCGNGLRCFAMYCYDKGISKSKQFAIVTNAGVKKVIIDKIEGKNANVIAELGRPDYKLSICREEVIDKEFVCDGAKLTATALNVGANHLVVFVDDPLNISESIGYQLSHNKLFDGGINVNFAKIEKDKLIIKTYERGVGFTKACGTGSCASFYVARSKGMCKDSITVNYPDGTLKISYRDDSLYLEGPAVRVGEVQIDIE